MQASSTTNRTRLETRDVLGPGAVAGLVGSIAWAAFATTWSATQGLDFWRPMSLVAGFFYGREAVDLGLVAVLAGLGTHLLVGIGFGVFFASLVRIRLPWSTQLVFALLYATGVYLVTLFVVLPWANPVMYEVTRPGAFYFYHLAYGFGLSTMLPLRRLMGSKPWRAPAPES